MAFTLGDIFIGSFPITQNFGARPEIYSAMFNLRGHNGIDFGAPAMTLVLAAADGIVTETGFDASGYGNYLKITHQGYLTLYGHLNDIQVKQGDHVLAGQLIGHSDNTGFSSAPHLHFGVAPCDEKGVKTEAANGYSGYIDPMGTLCHWDIKNLQSPVVPHEQTNPEVPVPASDFTRMVAQGTNFKVIATFAEQNNINDYLGSTGEAPLDLNTNPNDPEAGKKLTLWVSDLIHKEKGLQNQVDQANSPDISSQLSHLTDQQKTSLLQTVVSAVKGVFFTNG